VNKSNWAASPFTDAIKEVKTAAKDMSNSGTHVNLKEAPGIGKSKPLRGLEIIKPTETDIGSHLTGQNLAGRDYYHLQSPSNCGTFLKIAIRSIGVGA